MAPKGLGDASQKLATRSGCTSGGNYAKIERGTKNVTYDTLLRVADGLGVDLIVTLGNRRQSKRAV